MRLFVALDIDESIRENITRFTKEIREFAPDLRWVNPESLHVTLKFIGESVAVEEIKRAISEIRATQIEIEFRSYGFFPTEKSARVFWIGIKSGANLSALVQTINKTLIPLGIAKETHNFSPHLTLARTGSGRPNRGKEDGTNKNFERLQEKLSARPTPEFGTMTAREFFLYQSELSPKGSRYTKIASFALDHPGTQ